MNPEFCDIGDLLRFSAGAAKGRLGNPDRAELLGYGSVAKIVTVALLRG